jgi:hypothetical protein
MERRCPIEYTIYTKKTSEFFLTCQRMMDQNRFIDYSHNEDTMLPLSFYLVRYLCHVHDTRDHHAWVSVPIFFWDLWQNRSIGVT